MKLILAAALTTITASAPANEIEMMLVPRQTAEQIVLENLRLQKELEGALEVGAAMRKHIDKLQSSLNCS